MDDNKRVRMGMVGYVCCLAALVFFLMGLNGLVHGPGADYYAGMGVLHLVGLFVPAAVALVAGVLLLRVGYRAKT